MPHANFAQDISRGLVALAVRGEDAVEFEMLEPVPDNSLRRLCRIAITPEGNAKPVADFGALVRDVGVKSTAAAKTPVTAQADRQAEFVLFGDAGEEFAGVAFFVGMR